MITASIRFVFGGVVFAAAAAFVACTGSDPELVAPAGDGGGGTSSGATSSGDAGGNCDPLATFTTIEEVQGIHGGDDTGEGAPSLSENELTIYFNRVGLSGNFASFIHAGVRSNIDAPFGTDDQLKLEVDDKNVYQPSISSDGKTLLFIVESSRDGSFITVARRDRTENSFGPTESFAPSVGHANPDGPRFGVDSDVYYAVGDVDGGDPHQRPYRVAVTDGGFAEPTEMKGLAVTGADTSAPTVTRDGKYGYFHSTRDGNGGATNSDIFVARHESDQWVDIRRISELSTPASETVGWLSPDNCRLYFTRTGTVQRIYVAKR